MNKRLVAGFGNWFIQFTCVEMDVFQLLSTRNATNSSWLIIHLLLVCIPFS